MKFHEALQKAYPKLSITRENAQYLIVNDVIHQDIIEAKGMYFHFPEKIMWRCVNSGNCCKQDVPLHKEEVDSGVFEMKDGGDSLSYTNKFIKGVKGQRCPYLTDSNKCKVYNQRPLKCKTYPFVPMQHLGKNHVGLYIEMLEGFECEGFHLGRMKRKHFFEFAKIIKQEIRMQKTMGVDEILKNVSVKEFGKQLRKQIEGGPLPIDLSEYTDEQIVDMTKKMENVGRIV